MKKYKKGDVVKAKITGIESYGAFAKIDESYSGLIHISEITEDFVTDVSEYLSINDEVYVKVLEETSNNNQLKLSVKQDNSARIKKSKTLIKETVFGFHLLKCSLPKWIKYKINEINDK